MFPSPLQRPPSVITPDGKYPRHHFAHLPVLDDDGDSIPTLIEDVDGDGDVTNDDTDGDGTPDYRDIAFGDPGSDLPIADIAFLDDGQHTVRAVIRDVDNFEAEYTTFTKGTRSTMDSPSPRIRRPMRFVASSPRT